MKTKPTPSSFQTIDPGQLEAVLGGCACGCGQANCNCANGSCGQAAAPRRQDASGR